jgi:hypothetical protein
MGGFSTHRGGVGNHPQQQQQQQPKKERKISTNQSRQEPPMLIGFGFSDCVKE